MTDPLADLVGLIRPRAVLWKRIEGAGDWAVRFPGNSDVNFGMVSDGHCLLLSDGPPRALAAGDFLLLCGPPAFTFASAPGVSPQDGEALLDGAQDNSITVGNGGDAADAGPVRLIGGHFLLDPANSALLLDLVPALVHLHGSDRGARRISQLLDLLGDEAAADRPGAGFVLPRLVEVMLVEALRAGPGGDGSPDPLEIPMAAGNPASSSTPPAPDSRETPMTEGSPAGSSTPATPATPAPRENPAPGLLSGLADPPVAAALGALHADPARSWTVASLAAAAHLSRSVFAERFSARVGRTPISYLLAWRMALAKDALARGRTIDEVARTVGYGSASAFATAFRRFTGVAPGHYARSSGASW
ncbi:AraC family transcriptional regulator [Amycolatopsis sp. NBC_00345]|uniref:AraC family transcriptional regulator n=1 Tax=Amycolatopsis sp. NBC_00345 TaxID=2975955 RepID=UPI002E256CB5